MKYRLKLFPTQFVNKTNSKILYFSIFRFSSNNLMNMKNKNTSKPSASYYNVRNSLGQFTAQTESISRNTATKSSSVTSSTSTLPKLDSNGRFMSASSNSKVSVRNTSKPSTSVSKSSFIKNMTISNGLVNVVMTSRPHIVYTYRPTVTGLKSIQSAISSNGSLGTVYNQYLKGREVSRTIYKNSR